MSELKWNWAYAPYLDPPEDQKESAQNAGYVKVVSKDEADKVIAHANYKRCLAMANSCSDKASAEYAASYVSCDEYYYHHAGFWEKWHKRWLELAEKFKEADDA